MFTDQALYLVLKQLCKRNPMTYCDVRPWKSSQVGLPSKFRLNRSERVTKKKTG